jgi:hypothetical protein
MRAAIHELLDFVADIANNQGSEREIQSVFCHAPRQPCVAKRASWEKFS